jgi:ABC-type oligopeptide transport system substrate-binding subunit/DNA-binding SARP family transcriptional activator/tRNA A-37 threonylcarbamoyl transferase component Bud32
MSLRLLGPFEATVDRIPITHFRTKTVQALLIYLACQPEQSHRREGLMTLLWPGLPQESAQANLRQSLYLLRKAIPNVAAVDGGESVPFLLSDRQTIQVNPDALYDLDFLTFNRLIRDGIERWPDAVSLYRGDFLGDFYLPDSANFEEWTLSLREELRRRVLETLDALTTQAIRQREYDSAASYAQRQIAIDNLQESAYKQLIESLALDGDRAGAIGLYDAYRLLIADELGVEPAADIVEKVRQIRAGDFSIEAPGLPLGRGFELKEEIGAGAYGVVYRAFQPAAGRNVAIKIILPKYADQPDFAARFDAEAQMVARLEHPHIVPLYDTWRDENGAHLVMRLLSGGSLKDLLKTGPLEPEAAVKLIEQVASALHVAHKKGIVHRDLKPSNILFDKEGNAYLSDFGIAKNLAAEVTLTPTGAVVGTPDYIAPEQIRGEQLTPQADQYSLGLVMYEALTGLHPFACESIAALFHKHLTEPLPLVSAVRSDLPPNFDTVIHRATAKQPADRYPDIISFSEAVRQALLTGAQRRKFSEAEQTRDRAIIPGPQPPVPAFLEETAEPERPVFVGRESELDCLTGFLDAAVQGQDCVAFIAGDAGSGKTTLMQAFADRALVQQADLLVIQGVCNAFSGSGDPYLPFRSTMRMLTGDVESRWTGGTITQDQALNLWAAVPLATRALVEHGNELIETFVPGESLISRVSAAVPEDVILLQKLRQVVAHDKPVPGDIEQPELFEQFCQVLRTVAKERSILVLLDDLQWADSGSIDLLFHLGRSLKGARVLIVGAYRPEEISLGRRGKRHPLAPILDELKREYGQIWIDLNRVGGVAFVEAFLDTEPNRLDEEFRKMLSDHTDGHALFTVELLRDLQERGELVKDDDGLWVESPTLDWDRLPARVEGVIEARIGRLEDELREILTVAAVEGEDFTAQIVAQVQQIRERKLLRTLSRELQKRHQLVRERTEIQIGERLLSRYRFAHSLFQRYLYNDLGTGERRLLHGEIADILEEFYAGRLDEISVQLAGHYSEAGETGKAAGYLLKAGDQARLRFANSDAIDYYLRAMVALKEIGDNDRASQTLMKLGLTYHLVSDFKSARKAYDEGFDLWQRVVRTRSPAASTPASSPLRVDCFEPETLDPSKSIDFSDITVMTNIFSGLADYSDEMSVIPEVAKSWEMKDGGSRYIIHLRDDVYWSDGEPVTSHDFVLAWRRALDPAVETDLAGNLYDIEGARDFHTGKLAEEKTIGVRALDNQTLEVRLEGPTVYFPHLLAYNIASPVPRHIVSRLGDAWAEPQNIVTNGPFKIETREPDKPFTLVRNPNYHGRFAGNVERIEISLSHDITTRLRTFQADKLDILHFFRVPDVQKGRARQQFAEEYMTGFELTTATLAFDTRQPPFDDIQIRRAFALAIDCESICDEVWQGFFFPATGGYIPPGMPGHSPGIGLPYDPALAKQLMHDAGYPDGWGFPEVHVLSWPLFDQAFELISKSWRDLLGVDVQCLCVDWLDFLERIDKDKPQVSPKPWAADFPDPDNFMRVSLMSHSRWTNERFDQLVERARRIADPAKRMDTYREADRILVEEAAIVPIAHHRMHVLIKPWVRKYWIPRLSPNRWKHIFIEPH